MLWAVFVGAGAGCARLEVASNPSGAIVLWSPDGLDPWRPWPPLHWREYASPKDPATTVTTPLFQHGPQADYLFIRVEKPGYYPPRAELAGMRAWRTCRLEFTLQETPDHFTARQRDQGLVLYKGRWVDPAADGLVEHQGEWMTPAEKEYRINTAKGFVEFEGTWLTREEYETAYATQQQAKGLVEFKGRWVRPSVRVEEERIDQTVEEIRKSAPPETIPPKVLGRIESSMAAMELISAAEAPTRWLISGPSSRRIDLPPHGRATDKDMLLIPGRYTITVFVIPEGQASPARSGVTPAPPESPSSDLLPADPAKISSLLILIDQPLSGGFHYSFSYSPPATDEYKK